MGRNKDVVRLAEVTGVRYTTALHRLRAECDKAPEESLHQTALRLIGEAEKAPDTQEPPGAAPGGSPRGRVQNAP